MQIEKDCSNKELVIPRMKIHTKDFERNQKVRCMANCINTPSMGIVSGNVKISDVGCGGISCSQCILSDDNRTEFNVFISRLPEIEDDICKKKATGMTKGESSYKFERISAVLPVNITSFRYIDNSEGVGRDLCNSTYVGSVNCGGVACKNCLLDANNRKEFNKMQEQYGTHFGAIKPKASETLKSVSNRGGTIIEVDHKYSAYTHGKFYPTVKVKTITSIESVKIIVEGSELEITLHSDRLFEIHSPTYPKKSTTKFKVGDYVTYKSKERCSGYKHGGVNFEGYVGKVVEVNDARMRVTSPDGNYSMVPEEFEEYGTSSDNSASSLFIPENLKILQKTRHRAEEFKEKAICVSKIGGKPIISHTSCGTTACHKCILHKDNRAKYFELESKTPIACEPKYKRGDKVYLRPIRECKSTYSRSAYTFDNLECTVSKVGDSYGCEVKYLVTAPTTFERVLSEVVVYEEELTTTNPEVPKTKFTPGDLGRVRCLSYIVKSASRKSNYIDDATVRILECGDIYYESRGFKCKVVVESGRNIGEEVILYETEIIKEARIIKEEEAPKPTIAKEPEKGEMSVARKEKMPDKVFEVGQRVTYKPREKSYCFCGEDQSGHVGKIVRYEGYFSPRGCYSMIVTIPEGTYTMLECEFEEYDALKSKPSKSPFQLDEREEVSF